MKKEKINLLVSMLPDCRKNTIKIPPEQREGKIWSLEQKQNLIDSLYNDYDIPKIYFRKDSKTPSIWWLIDGQQRIESITEFLDNKYPLASDISSIPREVQGKKYKQLNPFDKDKIGSRTLDGILFEPDEESDEEEDMFLRLNNGTPLNAAEKRNAIKGEFRDSIKSLARHKFLKYKVSFSTKRYAYDAICAQLAAITLANGPTNCKGVALKKLYKDYKKFSEKKKLEAEIKKILNDMGKIFINKEPFMKRFYVVTIYTLLLFLSRHYSLNNITKPNIYKFFSDFEKQKIANTNLDDEDEGFKQDLFEFYEKSVNSPDGDDAIKARHSIITKRFLAYFKDLQLKDPQRNFTEEQKNAIYYLYDGKCTGVKGSSCSNKGKKLQLNDCEFDHIKEHDAGGTTTVGNGQLLCIGCHAYKTQQYKTKKREFNIKEEPIGNFASV